MTTGCIGLRQLCDWATFLTSVMPDYFANQILPELKLCGLKEFAGVLTGTAIRYLGLNSAYGMHFQSVRERDIQAMIDEILRAGSIHNRNNTEDGSSFFVDESGTSLSVRVFLNKINSLARRKFPITKKLPFLLPLILALYSIALLAPVFDGETQAKVIAAYNNHNKAKKAIV